MTSSDLAGWSFIVTLTNTNRSGVVGAPGDATDSLNLRAGICGILLGRPVGQA